MPPDVPEELSKQPAAEAPHLGDPATLRGLLDFLEEGLYAASPEGRFLETTPGTVRIFGAGAEEELRRKGPDVLWADPAAYRDLLRRTRELGAVEGVELQARRLDGDTVTLRVSCRALKGPKGELLGYCGAIADITERERLAGELQELGERDPLTGCFNRRYLEARRSELQRPTHFWGCLYFDLDDLGAVNEKFGTEEGDRVLQRFAHFINRNKRADDVLVRVGDDEFGLLVEVVSPDHMDLIAQRLVQRARDESPLGFGVGVAYRRPGEKMEEVLGRASEAMYAARGRSAAAAERRLAEDEAGSSKGADSPR